MKSQSIHNEDFENNDTDIQLQEVVDFSDEETQLAASSDELQIDEHENIDDACADAETVACANAYDSLDRPALLDVLEKLLNEKPVQNLKGEAEAIKVAFYKKIAVEQEYLRREFVAQSNSAEPFIMPDDGLEARLKELFAKYKKLRAELAEKQEQEREANLALKQAVIEELKHLLERQGDFNVIFNDFKQLQLRWRAIGAVPQPRQKEVWDVYNYNVEKFYDVVKINKELRELDFKKNFELKQLLCEKAEELLLKEDVVKAFHELQKYHEQWRDIGPVAAESREPLWERFKGVTTQINKKHADYFEQLKVEQQNNLSLKQALCEKAEELHATPILQVKEWNEKTQVLFDLQKMWKTIGAAPRKESNKIFRRFRAACTTFFDNRRTFFSEQKVEQQQNLQQKLELCAQAELLAESDEWKKTTDELVKIQAQWKAIGAVPHKQSDAVWKRFRAACNKFFDRKKEYFSTQDTRYDENLKKKENLTGEIINFVASDNPSDNLSAIKDFQQRWSEIGYVPMKHKERLQKEYRAAIDALFETLHVSAADRQLTSFKARIASSSDNGGKQIPHEREKLEQQLKHLKSDIQLWENNIGFFARSKNAEKLVQDVRNNIEKARHDLLVVMQKLDLLNSVKNKPTNT
ncbi:MAG: DUF349 domain-containing protein [Prevotellaceae bacterium]|jgi:hypothetical protein|nr:DUF349 domain-containing protein [Prevotellaceae bacterium]